MRYSALVLFLLLSSLLAGAATPLVNNTSIDYTTNRITINGQNFSVNPSVLFNAINLAPLVSATGQNIVANLPAGTQAATYRLRVTNNAGNIYQFDVTFGAVVRKGRSDPRVLVGLRGNRGNRTSRGSRTSRSSGADRCDWPTRSGRSDRSGRPAGIDCSRSL